MIVFVKNDRVINDREMLSLRGVTWPTGSGLAFRIDSWYYDMLKIACEAAYAGINPGQALRRKYVRVGIRDHVLYANGKRIASGKYSVCKAWPLPMPRYTVDRRNLKTWLTEAKAGGRNEADYIKKKYDAWCVV